LASIEVGCDSIACSLKGKGEQVDQVVPPFINLMYSILSLNTKNYLTKYRKTGSYSDGNDSTFRVH
jgi:hypothetical protein